MGAKSCVARIRNVLSWKSLQGSASSPSRGWRGLAGIVELKVVIAAKMVAMAADRSIAAIDQG